MVENLKIIQVPIPTPTLLPHTTTNCYLIGNQNESILVDAGYDLPETRILLENEIKKHNLAIPNKIILTHAHPDHAPGVKRLMHWSPTIYCHMDEKVQTLDAISPVDNISFLTDEEVLNVAGNEITVIHGPGHTKGHLSLYLPSTLILIAGDNIVAEGTTWIGAPDGNMSDYIQTLRRLRNLKLSKIGPGHGDWVLKPYEQIDFVIKRRLEREEQIKQLLQKHGQLTSNQLTQLIYKDSIHPSVFEVAKRTVEAHLVKLMEESSVTLKDSIYSFIAVS